MRVILIVFDSVGVGVLDDVNFYGDEGSNIFLNIFYVVGGIEFKNLYKFGIGNIISIKGILLNFNFIGVFGKSKEMLKGKDIIIGYWEIVGIVLEEFFKIFLNGFFEDLI